MKYEKNLTKLDNGTQTSSVESEEDVHTDDENRGEDNSENIVSLLKVIHNLLRKHFRK